MELHVTVTEPFAAAPAVKVGAGITATVKDFESVKCCAFTAHGLLSVTRTVTVLVVFMKELSGVQRKTPFVELMEAPAGAALRLNERPFAGRSGSVAEFVMARAIPA